MSDAIATQAQEAGDAVDLSVIEIDDVEDYIQVLLRCLCHADANEDIYAPRVEGALQVALEALLVIGPPVPGGPSSFYIYEPRSAAFLRHTLIEPRGVYAQIWSHVLPGMVGAYRALGDERRVRACVLLGLALCCAVPVNPEGEAHEDQGDECVSLWKPCATGLARLRIISDLPAVLDGALDVAQRLGPSTLPNLQQVRHVLDDPLADVGDAREPAVVGAAGGVPVEPKKRRASAQIAKDLLKQIADYGRDRALLLSQMELAQGLGNEFAGAGCSQGQISKMKNSTSDPALREFFREWDDKGQQRLLVRQGRRRPCSLDPALLDQSGEYHSSYSGPSESDSE